MNGSVSGGLALHRTSLLAESCMCDLDYSMTSRPLQWDQRSTANVGGKLSFNSC